MKKDPKMQEMMRYMAKRAIEPIKAMVENRHISPEMALGLVAQSLGQFDESYCSPEFRRFKENSGKIFESEAYFESEYPDVPGVKPYKYARASRADVNFFLKLVEGAEYSSPEELRAKAERALKGKRILEIGCGPGFALKVMQDLGAEPVGIEIRDMHKGKVPGLDIRYGDAADLGELCNDDKFDIIYSNNFFATAVIDFKTASRIARETREVIKDDGVAMHFVDYEKMNPVFAEFAAWVNSFQRGGVFYDVWESMFEKKDAYEQDDMMWVNTCSLDPQFLLRAGFRVDEYAIQNGDLVITARCAEL